ncbi:beta-propeller domain-containing protein [Actinocorallia lasiicapitis]
MIDAPPMRLVAFDGCDGLLKGLRASAVKRVGPYGLDRGMMPFGAALMDSAFSSKSAAIPQAAMDQVAVPESSGTNNHEGAADEPDAVKNDGNRLFVLRGGTVKVIDTATREVSKTIKLPKGYEGATGLLLSGERLLVLAPGWDGRMYKGRPGFAPGAQTTRILQLDLATGRTLNEIKADASLVDARMTGTVARIVIRSSPDIPFPERTPYNGSDSEKYQAWEKEATKENQKVAARAPLEAFQPSYEIDGRRTLVPCEQISRPAGSDDLTTLTVLTVDLAGDRTRRVDPDPVSVVAEGDTVYGNGQSLYIAGSPWRWAPILDSSRPFRPRPAVTQIHKFALTGAERPAYVASGQVDGSLLNQYSLSEHQGNLRVATTQEEPRQESRVTVLAADGPALKKIGEIGGLGKKERIYGVRFVGDRGYVVTFRQVDPLYSLDLSDPRKPVSRGELKITGYSAYLHPTADGKLIGVGMEADKRGRALGAQVSLFDVEQTPKVIQRQVLPGMWGTSAEYDPHAFLYWPKTGLTVVPAQEKDGGNPALVFTVRDGEIKRLGTLRHPKRYTQIQRAVLIGDALWTVSDRGVQINAVDGLAKLGWIALPTPAPAPGPMIID